MKKVLAGLVTVVVATGVAVPAVEAGVDFNNLLKTSSLSLALPKDSKQKEEVKHSVEETKIPTVAVEKKEVKPSNNETIAATNVDTEVVQETTQAVVTTTVIATKAPVTTQPVTTINSKQEAVTTTQVSRAPEVYTTTVAPATTQKEVVLGANDLFGMVGHPGSEYNTPEFQAKWDAMMAERTVNDEGRFEKLVEHNE